MKIFRLFSIAAAALMMAACSTEDSTQQATPGKLHFTATIAAPNSGAGTRTEYTEDTENKKITVAWKVGDEIALVHDKVMDVVKVKTVNADGSATIDGTITSATDEATVQLVYPAALVSDNNVTDKRYTQDGTLKYIQDNLDFRDGKGQLSVDGNEVTLAEAADMVSSIAIWKLTLQDSEKTALKATQVVIKCGGEAVASTDELTTAVSSVYLALPAFTTTSTVTIEATTAEGTYTYSKENLTLKTNAYYQSTVTLAKAAIDLSKLTANYTAQDGDILTGTLGKNVQISIAKGATVTLDGVTITGENSSDYKWAGITCEGDATIILKDGKTNTVTGFHQNYPGIYVPSEMTLTIKGETAGTGILTASSNGGGAGIGGGGNFIHCGNIEIQGGVITATGSSYAAGIGGANSSSCGTITISGGSVTATGGQFGAGIGSGSYTTCGSITISGGTVTATGGDGGAGIGSGSSASCGDITISGGTVEATGGSGAAGIGSGRDENGGGSAECGTVTITADVTKVTANKGSEATNSIGAGHDGTCGTVTIGCTLNSDGNPVDGTTGAISTSPYTYP